MPEIIVPGTKEISDFLPIPMEQEFSLTGIPELVAPDEVLEFPAKTLLGNIRYGSVRPKLEYYERGLYIVTFDLELDPSFLSRHAKYIPNMGAQVDIGTDLRKIMSKGKSVNDPQNVHFSEWYTPQSNLSQLHENKLSKIHSEVDPVPNTLLLSAYQIERSAFLFTHNNRI